MKAKDWEFEKILPDIDDAEARYNCCRDFMNLPEIKLNDGERRVGDFSAGFNRGLAWAKAKYEIKD